MADRALVVVRQQLLEDLLDLRLVAVQPLGGPQVGLQQEPDEQLEVELIVGRTAELFDFGFELG